MTIDLDMVRVWNDTGEGQTDVNVHQLEVCIDDLHFLAQTPQGVNVLREECRRLISANLKLTDLILDLRKTAK